MGLCRAMAGSLLAVLGSAAGESVGLERPALPPTPPREFVSLVGALSVEVSY